MADRRSRTIRVLIAIVLISVGLLVSVMVAGASGTVAIFAQSLGLGLIVTGCLSVFEQVVSSPSATDETRRQIDRLTGVLAKPGLRIVAPKRRGNPRYYKWVLENEVQEAFFAGHSILHRVDEDFQNRGLLPVQDALRKKISEGSKIRILFVDPTWDFVDHVGRAGGRQEPQILKHDLVKTLAICKQLRETLQGEKSLPGMLDIRACQAIVQYAFHHVACAPRRTDEMLIGFYFADRPGTETPLFETDDEEVRKCFTVHFSTIFDKATSLLSYAAGSLEFNDRYFQECINVIADKLGENAVESLR